MIDRVLILSLGGCTLFGVVLFLELTSADRNQPAVVRAPARVEAAAAAPVRGPRIDELLATVLGRPLFSATRKPPEAKEDRPVDMEIPNMRLTGIVIEPDRHLAIFAVPGAKPMVRSEGETVNEWQLDSIEPRQVSLSGPAGTTTIEPKTDPSIIRAAPAAQPTANSSQPAPPGRPSLAMAPGRPPVPAVPGPQQTSSFMPPASIGAPRGAIPPRPSQ